MKSLKSVLSSKMQEVDATLDVVRSDRKMLQIAYVDFLNYVRFNWRLSVEETSHYDVAEKIERFLDENPAELDSSLTVWMGIWMKKWKARVKLLIGNQEHNTLFQGSGALARAEVGWKKLACKDEMMGLVASALIRNAEICGTQVLAEHVLKLELSKMDNFDPDSKEQMFTILNNALWRVHSMTNSVGPLFFLKVDKAYYADQVS
jgi:hypothetical protein